MERAEHVETEIKDTSYAREGTGHHLRSVANKVKDKVTDLLEKGALTPSDVEFISTQP